ncbi:hypothetical protein [Nocardia anaemiae]|uniref:hypothetical protein n=1 Tax=Nocardia anaemiae TaxID=263910 RepID=UPI000B286493|nr:hypothetical protein [Nocardia anaemiae]
MGSQSRAPGVAAKLGTVTVAKASVSLRLLAHNRFRYEKIRARYKSLQLDSFAASAEPR